MAENSQAGLEKYLSGKYAVIIAIISGVLGIVLLVSYTQSLKKQMGDTVTIIIARNTLPAGTTLSENNVGQRKVPLMYAPKNYILASRAYEIYDSPINVNVAGRNPILYDYLEVNTAFSRLSDEIAQGKRALTISVNNESGVAGYLNQNDRVDIIIRYFGAIQDKEAMVTKTILQNVPVLRVGNAGRPSGYSNVTLVVTPEEAELLQYSQGVSVSGLHLTLRNSADLDIEDLSGRDWGEFR